MTSNIISSAASSGSGGSSTWWNSLGTIASNNSDATIADGVELGMDEAAAVQRKLLAEEDVRPTVNGVVSIKIKSASLVTFDPDSTVYKQCYCNILVRNFQKRTRVVSLNSDGMLVWDQVKHFSVPVVRNRRHPFNVFQIQLVGFENSNPDQEVLVGTIGFHLHDIISASPLAGRYDIWNETLLVGDLELELTFNYGSFGYGYSLQLKEDDVKPEEMLTYSLFPRITPREDEQEPEDPILIVKAKPHPKFLPIKEPAYLSYGKEIQSTLKTLESSIYSPDALMKHLDMGHLESVRDRYFGVQDRVERLMMLHEHLKKRNSVPERANPQPANAANNTPSYSSILAKAYSRFVQPLYQFLPGKQDMKTVFRKKIMSTVNTDIVKDEKKDKTGSITANNNTNARGPSPNPNSNILRTAAFDNAEGNNGGLNSRGMTRGPNGGNSFHKQ